MSNSLAAAPRYCPLKAYLPMPDEIPHPIADPEAALIAQAQAGSEAGFEQLVREYRNQVYALSYHFLHNREAAWDAAQETFIKAYRSLRKFRRDATFKTWLLRIAANHCKDELKKNRLQTVPLEYTPQSSLKNHDPSPAKNLQDRELGITIRRAIDELPIKQRTAFLLREFEGLSYQEMAEVIGCSTGTVMSRLHHARKKLQQLLRDEGIVED